MKAQRSGQAEIFSQEQLEELWGTLPDSKYRLLFRIAYFTAGRIGEVAQLQVSDIGNGKVIYRGATTKTNETREIAIPTYLQAEIEAYCKDEGIISGYLFPSKGKAGYLSNQVIDKVLRQKLDYLGWYGFSTHSFRRTMLTNYYNKTGSLTLTRELSKHSSLASLEKYLACTNKAAMEKLEALW